jgi:hypothetical protein
MVNALSRLSNQIKMVSVFDQTTNAHVHIITIVVIECV